MFIEVHALLVRLMRVSKSCSLCKLKEFIMLFSYISLDDVGGHRMDTSGIDERVSMYRGNVVHNFAFAARVPRTRHNRRAVCTLC